MNLLVTGAFAWTEEELNTLKQLGHEVMFMQQEKDALPCDAAWVEGVVCNGLFLSHPIEQFTSLKYIQLTSAGFDRVPMDYVKSKGIHIFNARGVYSIPMAEFAISGVLELYKDKRLFYGQQKDHAWVKHRDIRELSGKKVCIIGCGSVGTECAKRFQAFGCHVVGIDVMPYQNKWYEQIVTLHRLSDILPTCDIVVLTLPLTEETKGIISKQRLESLKEGAVLVNISRGAVVDQKALEAVLSNKRIEAVLDVFDAEPLAADSPLWDMDNVVISPHNSFVGDGNHERLCAMMFDHLEKQDMIQ